MSLWLFIHLFISTNVKLLNFESSQEKLNGRKRSYQDQSPPQQQWKQQTPQWGSFATLSSLPSPPPCPAQHTGQSDVEPRLPRSRLHRPLASPAKPKGKGALASSAGTRHETLDLLVLLMAEPLSFCGEAVSCGSSRCSCLTSGGMAGNSESTVRTNDEFLAMRRLEKGSFLYTPLHHDISLCTFGFLSGTAI